MRHPLLLSLAFAIATSCSAELQNVEIGPGIRVRNPDEHFAGTMASVLLKFQPGTDLGQSLGTLFELKDADGKVVLGAGFDDAHSTYMRDNNRQMVFYYKSPAPEATVSAMVLGFAPG